MCKAYARRGGRSLSRGPRATVWTNTADSSDKNARSRRGNGWNVKRKNAALARNVLAQLKKTVPLPYSVKRLSAHLGTK
jgi:hypothetical protein